VLGVVGSLEKIGASVDMQPVANVANQNWIVSATGTVSTFYASGLATAAMDQNYPNNQDYEYEYDPYGVTSGLCLGVSGTAQNGTSVTLQPCGLSAATTWVAGAADQSGDVPLINGTNTNFTQPFVLTAKSTSANATTSSLGGAGTGQYWNTEHWA
jgi:hypothetical protein